MQSVTSVTNSSRPQALAQQPAVKQLTQQAINLLQQLIATQSFSGQEEGTAQLLANFLAQHGATPQRKGNNIWAVATNCPKGAPVVLLNSHHDTVKPGKDWQQDPFTPTLDGDKLTGLGSNDAGASAVSMLATFVYLAQLPALPYQLVVAITAEEENSGANGVRSILPLLPTPWLGLVGEPTGMQMAVAEKGLIVLDCQAQGKTGHAARNEGVNALYKAVDDINWLRNYTFTDVSDTLGPVKMTVTQIEAGQQHNVVPATCRFVVDVRTNDCYTNQAIIEIIKSHISAEISPRSYHLNASSIPLTHPVVQVGQALGLSHYGSPTLSDQSVMDFTTMKIGPGQSARSHTAGEYIYLSEIQQGVATYIALLEALLPA